MYNRGNNATLGGFWSSLVHFAYDGPGKAPAKVAAGALITGFTAGAGAPVAASLIAGGSSSAAMAVKGKPMLPRNVKPGPQPMTFNSLIAQFNALPVSVKAIAGISAAGLLLAIYKR